MASGATAPNPLIGGAKHPQIPISKEEKQICVATATQIVFLH